METQFLDESFVLLTRYLSKENQGDRGNVEVTEIQHTNSNCSVYTDKPDLMKLGEINQENTGIKGENLSTIQ